MVHGCAAGGWTIGIQLGYVVQEHTYTRVAKRRNGSNSVATHTAAHTAPHAVVRPRIEICIILWWMDDRHSTGIRVTGAHLHKGGTQEEW